MDLKSKGVFVTGAASGLGLAVCRRLAAMGARVAAIDLDEAKLQAAHGDEAVCLPCDVADEESVRRVVDDAANALGGLHVVVNCAGVIGAAKTVSRSGVFPADMWQRIIAVNLTGTFNVVRHAALVMSRNAVSPDGERGVIVNTASGAAWQGQMGQAAYSASKAGVIGMTLPVARDLAGFGIRVMAIAPGLFETGMSAGMPAHVSQGLIDNTMLFPNRMGEPDEFARLVQQIVENPYLNATTISLDGGARVGNRM